MLNNVIQNTFGFPGLRPGQVPIVDSISQGMDTFAIMTTGGGKSLCYQSTAINDHQLKNGATIIISPLISLMQDQVDALEEKGVSVGVVNSSVPTNLRYKTLASLHQGKLPMIYLSPEMLASDEVKECLKHSSLCRIVYDEAHTVSIWGASFRPSYARVNNSIQEIETFQGKRLQRCAFTATSHKEVTEDVINLLGMTQPNVIQGNPDRENIAMFVESSTNKTQDCMNILSQDPDLPTIVYSTTVRGVKSFSQRLKEKGYNVAPYYASLNDEVKKKTLRGFLSGEITTIVATIAFGMGIDKDNVRRVIHMDMPASLENYYQEIGRGGRDGKPSTAHLLYSPNDRATHNYFLHWQFPSKDIIDEVRSTAEALISSGPQSFTPGIIAAACRSEIDPRHVVSSLRLLHEFGILEMEEEKGSKNLRLAEGNSDNHVDYDLLNKRQSVISNKLTTMKRYSITSNCKRKFLLEYFGHPGHSGYCGNCGTCLKKVKDNERTASKVSINDREAIQQAITACGGKYETTIAILAGRSTSRMTRRGYEKSSAFGSLAHHSDEHIRQTIKQLNEDGFIKILDSQLVVKADMSSTKISPKVADLRKLLGQSLKLPAFMVMSDAQAKELSKSPEIDTSSLEKVGLTSKVLEHANKILLEHELGSSMEI